jgi:hypothetical protein
MSLRKNQHEEFARFFEKPSRVSLRELLRHNYGEQDNLDFKAEWPSFNKLAKHVLALSNSGGGVIIVGVEEKDDGTIEPVGIAEILDKEKINKGIKKYIPSEVIYLVLDFHYEESEYPVIKGKKFQVMLVEYEPKYLPIISLNEGEGIKANVAYVRRGTSTDEANHKELQKLINKRIETEYSSKNVLELSEHLEQLKNLYKAKALNIKSAFLPTIGMCHYGNLSTNMFYINSHVTHLTSPAEGGFFSSAVSEKTMYYNLPFSCFYNNKSSCDLLENIL